MAKISETWNPNLHTNFDQKNYNIKKKKQNPSVAGMCKLFNSAFQGASNEDNLFCYPSFVLDSSGGPYPNNHIYSTENWDDCNEEAERKGKSFNLCRICPINGTTTSKRGAGSMVDCDFCKQNLSYSYIEPKSGVSVYPSMLVCQRVTWSETIKDRAAADPTNYILQIIWQSLLIFLITNVFIKFFVYLTLPNAYMGLWPISRAIIGYSAIILTTIVIMVFGVLMVMDMNNGHFNFAMLAAHEAIVISIVSFLEGGVVIILTSLQISKLQMKEWQASEADLAVNGEGAVDASIVTEGEEDNIIGLLEGGRKEKYYYELVQTDIFSLVFEYITYRRTKKRRFYG